ncbi:sugar ABC transporter ATP-binding protein [Aureimonas sp. AU4]|uniref:sugar ABC transporter ATP-binding protein n=1 Tax=Aureimonas sp. AU4 TaxID=1638163 RepID=UPI000783C941|nr:sugar ABC transporter ATP-binding protein [Aureimonas sp. AU4]
MVPDPILHATGIAKTYGAVSALRNASLELRRGEVHALMGANGAGKSTFVKILTGAIRPSAGRILVRGRETSVRSPAEARRAGLVSVYQEPSLIPDLDIRSNLRLTATPEEPFRRFIEELGLGRLDLGTAARDVPLAHLRVLDLARALAIEPDVLILDEMTAALPADLAERVLATVRQQSRAGRSVIFISHRFVEIAALCDRATVLRDGETVGVLAIEPQVEERIVELMLGARIEKRRPEARARAVPTAENARVAVRDLGVGQRLSGVSFDLRPGEVLGVVALEGQGQDELFDALSGLRAPTAGTIAVDGEPVRFRHPADAIGKGIALVPGDRSEALLSQRSVSENVALPFSARLRDWGPLRRQREQRDVSGAIERLQIDTRAQREVRRLSGGNQQKVTIARWIAAGARTLLCFDPTRGIDVRTKNQIYGLMRELAEQGHSVLFYTSELDEIPRACDRVVVIFNGRLVDTMPAGIADEAVLTRAAYGLPRGTQAPVGILAGEPAAPAP